MRRYLFNLLAGRQGVKTFGIVLGCILFLLLMLMINLSQGQVNMGLSDVMQAFLYGQGTASDQMIWQFRLPRTVAGLLCGAALAVAGALLQTVLRNPLASAGTLGINAGAYFAVVVGTIAFPAFISRFPLVFALAGGFGAVFVVYVLAGGSRSTPIRVVLAGMIVTLLLSSFTSVAQILFLEDAKSLFAWGSGSLAQNNWNGVQATWPWIILALAFVVSFMKSLDLLGFGEESAASLGQRVLQTKLMMFVIAVLLATVSVSLAGPIGFVGLLAPHMIRLMGIRKHHILLPASAVLGAGILLGADALTYPFQATYGNLPVGAVTAAIGGPWLIWMIMRMRKSKAGGHATHSKTGMSGRTIQTKIAFPLLCTILGVLLFLLLLYGIMRTGGMALSAKQLWLAIFGYGDEQLRHIVWNLRLPRLTAALFGGAALAVAGLLIQGAVRNPLADPSVIGVTSGAGSGVLTILVIWPYAPGWVLTIFAFIGAVIAAMIVFGIAWRSGFNPGILILGGISVTAVGTALIQFLVLKTTSFSAALIWLAGSTYARGWSDAIPLVLASFLLLPIAWWLGKRVELLAFDDGVALGLGLHVQRSRLIAAAIGVTLASTVVATVGTIGFVGLLAPHAARLLTGQQHRKMVVLAAIIGAILLTAADISGRLIALPKEIPSGLMVALIGSPYLLYLLYQSGKGRMI